jgi:ketosteroid isomerase-like protein
MSEWEDHLAVRSVIERYFVGIDRGDWPMVAACFAADVVVEVNAGSPNALVWRGRDETIAGSQRGLAKRMPRTHVSASTAIEIDGDRARAATSAVAFIGEGDGTPSFAVRGLRYDDDLVNEAGVWRIVRRRHSAQWQFATELDLHAVPPASGPDEP